MPLLKPIRAIQLNKSHPLARDLTACWLLNEGTGGKIFDASGNGNTGTAEGETSWAAGLFGSHLHFDGTDDYVDCGTSDFDISETNKVSVLAWIRPQTGGSSSPFVIQRGQFNRPFGMAVVPSTGRARWVVRTSDSNWLDSPPGLINVDQWSQIVGTYTDGDQKIYVDGILQNSDTLTGSLNCGNYSTTLARSPDSSSYWFSGEIDHVLIFNRCLTAEEIAWLYREPFAIFGRPISPESMLVPVAVVWVAGFVNAQSDISATLRLLRQVSGTVTSTCSATALLKSICIWPKIERNWLRDALFIGMTANAFKLGTTLSLGWFWVRVAGCSALFRGPSMEQIDFTNILTVAEQSACVISPPSYLPHNDSSTYFYVIRRFNNCGYQELTLAAAAKVSVDASGELEKPQPNKLFASKAEQVDGNKIQLIWFYCPLEQNSQPVCFNVHSDNRTGQIDYENPIATIAYHGRKFYSFQSDTLEAGRYLFAIRAEDADSVENNSLAQLSIQLDAANPDPIDILSTQTV